MITHKSCSGISYLLFELNGLRQLFVAAAPRQGTSLAEQTRDVLDGIDAAARDEGIGGKLIRQAVFLRDLADQQECRAILNEFYGPDLPATTFIAQPPCDGSRVAIEAIGLGGSSDAICIERHNEHLVVTHRDGVTWAHIANVTAPEAPGPLFDRSLGVFQTANNQLKSQGLEFDQVVRTWLYLGDITGPEAGTQRYKELNRARTDFYRDIAFGRQLLPAKWPTPVYPASTGIGAEGRDLVLSLTALGTARRDVCIVPLENPRQTAACDYELRFGPQSPKFARGMGVVGAGATMTFISGTASIIDSQTRHLDDAGRQTQETLNNIEALIAPANYARYGFSGCGSSLDHLAMVRVYVKRLEDYATVQSICQSRLGPVPTIYAVADICRPDLLVEIEGMAFSPRTG